MKEENGDRRQGSTFEKEGKMMRIQYEELKRIVESVEKTLKEAGKRERFFALTIAVDVYVYLYRQAMIKVKTNRWFKLRKWLWAVRARLFVERGEAIVNELIEVRGGFQNMMVRQLEPAARILLAVGRRREALDAVLNGLKSGHLTPEESVALYTDYAEVLTSFPYGGKEGVEEAYRQANIIATGTGEVLSPEAEARLHTSITEYYHRAKKYDKAKEAARAVLKDIERMRQLGYLAICNSYNMEEEEALAKMYL